MPSHLAKPRKRSCLIGGLHPPPFSSANWRRRWDSNPRALSGNTISSRARYDHFDTSPSRALLPMTLPDAFLYCIRLAEKIQGFLPGIFTKRVTCFSGNHRAYFLRFSPMAKARPVFSPPRCFNRACFTALFVCIRHASKSREQKTALRPPIPALKTPSMPWPINGSRLSAAPWRIAHSAAALGRQRPHNQENDQRNGDEQP